MKATTVEMTMSAHLSTHRPGQRSTREDNTRGWSMACLHRLADSGCRKEALSDRTDIGRSFAQIDVPPPSEEDLELKAHFGLRMLARRIRLCLKATRELTKGSQHVQGFFFFFSNFHDYDFLLLFFVCVTNINADCNY